MALYIMCDPIHGIMELDKDVHEVIKYVIDTKHFQRLRHIKQLSFAEFAYPGAVHSRFSHCIGASYLANKMYNVLEFDKTFADMTCLYKYYGLVRLSKPVLKSLYSEEITTNDKP